MNSVDTIFFLCLLGTSYSYFIYPIILSFLPKQSDIDFLDKDIDAYPETFITLIVTAYNEESNIQEKIQNTLEIDYPPEQREILIASDGSTDKTNGLVRTFSNQGVRLIEVSERKGKENAQLSAIRAARGEILVFSDVATRIPPEAIKYIVQTFENPRVGAISSEDRFITEDGKIAGEGAYVKYEMWLRRKEAEVKSLVGLSGSFFACRKIICEEWDINVPSDFNTALNCVRKGYIAVSHPGVLGYYPNLKDESKEYQRKLRTAIRGMAAVAANPSALNPFKFGIFSLEVFSHKIMRWLVPWFMLILFITNLFLWQTHILYTFILIGQVVFYSIAITGWLIKSTRTISLVKIPFFFMQVNIAIAHAGTQFISGKRITMWEPSKR